MALTRNFRQTRWPPWLTASLGKYRLLEWVTSTQLQHGPVELATLSGVAEDIEFKLPAELNE
jgi:hypothetical protein